MTPPLRARYLPGRVWISVPRARKFSLLLGEDGNLHALVADHADVSLTSLNRAVNAYRDAVGERWIAMRFYALDPPKFDPGSSPAEPVDFEFARNQMRLRVQYTTTGNDPAPYPSMLQVAGTFLRRFGARVVRTSHYDEFGRVRHFVEFEFVSLRGRRVRSALHLAHELSTLASAVSAGGALNASAVEHIIRANGASILVGQREHQTFEAKGSLYNLKTAEGQFELAKDVAAFANGGSEGLIVCGLRTTKRRDGDVVAQLNPLPTRAVRPRDWARTIRRLVVPSPEGLRIHTIPTDTTRGYVLICVPGQPEHVRPFLVRGGKSREGDGVIETFVTVPIRVGEHTEFSDAAALHGLLAAGRVALRRPR